MREILRLAPKAELHVHLDGAFHIPTLFKAARAHLEELPETVFTPWNQQHLSVREAIRGCGDDLASFEKLVTMGEERGLFPMLDAFYMFLPIVRGRMSLLEELAFEFCRERAAQNIVYTEVRYSAHEFLVQVEGKCVADGPSASDAVEAVCRGLERGQTEFGVVVRQILCCIGSQPSWSEETAVLAKKFNGKGVVGIDIASGEMHFDDPSLQSAHSAALSDARTTTLGVTVHAGEVGPAENVKTSLDTYGAGRIGHGYHALDLDPIYCTCKQRGTHFELCPTSSVATGAVELGVGVDWLKHPAKQFCMDRTSCSISTDDPSVFRCTLTDELITCVDGMGLSLEDIMWMTVEALKGAFNLEAEIRAALEAKVKAYYEPHVPSS